MIINRDRLLEFTEQKVRARVEATYEGVKSEHQISQIVKKQMVKLSEMDPEKLASSLLGELEEKDFYHC